MKELKKTKRKKKPSDKQKANWKRFGVIQKIKSKVYKENRLAFSSFKETQKVSKLIYSEIGKVPSKKYLKDNFQRLMTEDLIDFTKIKPAFENGVHKWYNDKYFQNYLESQQADNLPKLKGLGCFVVKSEGNEDYVLIDNKQNVLAYYQYNIEGFGQMEAKINIIKIKKHFEDYEKSNI